MVEWLYSLTLNYSTNIAVGLNPVRDFWILTFKLVYGTTVVLIKYPFVAEGLLVALNKF